MRQATAGRLVAAAAYLLIFFLGVMEGLLGSFDFSLSAGRVPVAALGFCALVLVTCLFAGAGMGGVPGSLAAGAGWLGATLVLTMPTPGGSVIITGTAAGEWYLYGGVLCAAIGVVAASRWQRRAPDPR